MPRSGPRTVRRYSDKFKLAAVRLSQEPGIQVQTVAAALVLAREIDEVSQQRLHSSRSAAVLWSESIRWHLLQASPARLPEWSQASGV